MGPGKQMEENKWSVDYIDIQNTGLLGSMHKTYEIPTGWRNLHATSTSLSPGIALHLPSSCWEKICTGWILEEPEFFSWLYFKMESTLKKFTIVEPLAFGTMQLIPWPLGQENAIEKQGLACGAVVKRCYASLWDENSVWVLQLFSTCALEVLYYLRLSNLEGPPASRAEATLHIDVHRWSPSTTLPLYKDQL